MTFRLREKFARFVHRDRDDSEKPFPKPPRYALPLLIVVIVVALAMLLVQIVVFRGSDPPTSAHEANERLYWIVTNVELFAPAAVTAILAWLTYTLIKYTVSALNLAQKQANDEEKRARKEFEPFLDIDVFSVKAPVTRRGRYELMKVYRGKYEQSPVEMWSLRDSYSTRQTTLPDGEPSAFAAMSLEGAYPLVVRAELICTLRNIGRGAAHSVRLSLVGFTWEERSFYDDDQREVRYRRLYAVDPDDRQAPIWLSIKRSVQLFPAKGEQVITAIMDCSPDEGCTGPQPSFQQAGAYVSVRYKAFGDEMDRELGTAIFFEQTVSGPGAPSAFEVRVVETRVALNPTLEIRTAPRVPFYDPVPHFDSVGDELIAEAARTCISEGLAAMTDAQVNAYLKPVNSDTVRRDILEREPTYSWRYPKVVLRQDIVAALSELAFGLWFDVQLKASA